MEKIKSYIPLNFDLIANPINWAIITLMVLMAGIGLALVVRNLPSSTGTN